MKRGIAVLASVLSIGSAFAGQVFYWRGGDNWAKWSDSTKWSLTKGADDNPSSLIPGADDTLWAYGFSYSGDNGKYGYLDMDGDSRTIAGFSAGSAAGNNWKTYYVHVDNGSLTILNPSRPSGVNLTHSFKVYSKGCLTFASGGGVHLVGISGLYSNWEVCNGGRMDVLSDEFQFCNVSCYVQNGGTMVFDPAALCVSKEMSNENLLRNEGTFIAPRGIIWNGSDCTSPSSASYTKTLRVKQGWGTMILGGNFTKTTVDSKRACAMIFELSEGTLVASNDVSFCNSVSTYGNEVSASMTRNAAVDVLANSSLDMTLFTYESGKTLTKKGPGPLTLANLPAGLTLNGGRTVLTKPLTDETTVSCASGVTVEFGAPGNVATAGIAGYSAATFKVTSGKFARGDVVVSSEDGDFLDYVCAQLADQAPQGTKAAVSGNAVRFVVDEGHIFTSTGEASLDDPSCWNDQTVPAGEDVHLSGAETIGVISASTTAFRSITIEDGATLKVVGSGVALPPVALTRTGRLLVAEEAQLVLANDTVAFGGDASGLPVFEIATNAVCTVPGGFVFKNVDLHLCGQVKLDETTAGYLTFGGTAADETTYFGMTAIGGSIYAKGSGEALKRFVYPGARGRVKVVGDLLLKDVTFEPAWFDAYNADGYNGFYIGNNNPEDEVFNVVLDNTLLPVVRYCYIQSGTKVIARNGGGFKKGPSHPGVDTMLMIVGKAKLRLEGPESGIAFSHVENGGFKFSPSVDNYEALTLVDGAFVNTHDLGGNYVRLVVSNGVWCVPSLPMIPEDHIPYPPDGDARNWITNAFCCFAGGVRIEPESTLTIKSAAGLGGTEWDRYMTLADRPMTGGGALTLENGTPGRSLTVTLVSGKNTCTGPLSVTPGEDPTTFYLNDGANWAGEVRSAGVALTNLASAADAATVSIGSLRVDGTMPIRLWADGTQNDRIDLQGNITAAGGKLKPVTRGGRCGSGASYVIGSCPADAAIPSAAEILPRGWALTTESAGEGRKSIVLTRDPFGLTVLVR